MIQKYFDIDRIYALSLTMFLWPRQWGLYVGTQWTLPVGVVRWYFWTLPVGVVRWYSVDPANGG